MRDPVFLPPTNVADELSFQSCVSVSLPSQGVPEYGPAPPPVQGLSPHPLLSAQGPAPQTRPNLFNLDLTVQAPTPRRTCSNVFTVNRGLSASGRLAFDWNAFLLVNDCIWLACANRSKDGGVVFYQFFRRAVPPLPNVLFTIFCYFVTHNFNLRSYIFEIFTVMITSLLIKVCFPHHDSLVCRRPEGGGGNFFRGVCQSFCPQPASWLLGHCSSLLKSGRYASYWNAF